MPTLRRPPGAIQPHEDNGVLHSVTVPRTQRPSPRGRAKRDTERYEARRTCGGDARAQVLDSIDHGRYAWIAYLHCHAKSRH